MAIRILGCGDQSYILSFSISFIRSRLRVSILSARSDLGNSTNFGCDASSLSAALPEPPISPSPPTAHSASASFRAPSKRLCLSVISTQNQTTQFNENIKIYRISHCQLRLRWFKTTMMAMIIAIPVFWLDLSHVKMLRQAKPQKARNQSSQFSTTL
jgi:hypothetical protein